MNVNPKVIVDFYAQYNRNFRIILNFIRWCGPCKMISPLLEKSAQNNPDVSFLKVNVDEAQELAAEYKVTALPTIAAFKNSNIKEKFMGVRDAKFIENFIKENLD